MEILDFISKAKESRAESRSDGSVPRTTCRYIHSPDMLSAEMFWVNLAAVGNQTAAGPSAGHTGFCRAQASTPNTFIEAAAGTRRSVYMRESAGVNRLNLWL